MSEQHKLFEKYVHNQLSKQEKSRLTVMLSDPSGQAAFARYIADWTVMSEAVRQIQHLRTEKGQSGSRTSARRLRLIWQPTLAMAASVLVVAGIFLMQAQRGDDSLLAGIKAVGQVDITDNRFVVGPDAYCRIDLHDGSQLALAPGAVISLSRDSATGAVTVSQEAGRMFLDIATRTEPFFIKSGTAVVNVIGTRLLMEPDKVLSVLSGRVRIDWQGFTATAEAGQRVIYGTDPVSGKWQLRIQPDRLYLSDLAWLEHVAMDPSLILQEAAFTSTAIPVNHLDFRAYTMQGDGTWTFDRQPSGGMAIRQSNPNAVASVVLSPRRWQRGTVSARFRVLEQRNDGSVAVGMALQHATGTAVLTLSEPLHSWLESFEWFSMRTRFETGATPPPSAVMEIWPDDRPDLKKAVHLTEADALAWEKSEQNTCAVGLVAWYGAVEFQDVVLLPDAEGLATTVVMPESPDLIAFYSFQNGGGTEVKDLSGTGTPMDMTIHRPENVKWLEDALRVMGPADIRYRGTGEKLKSAWQQNGGLTFEFWIRPSDGKANEAPQNRRLFCLTTGEGLHLWWRSRFVEHHEVVRDAVVFMDGESQSYGIRVGDKAIEHLTIFPDRNINLHSQRGPIGIHWAPSFDTGASGLPVWTGDLIAIAIYGRPLTPEELLLARRAD